MSAERRQAFYDGALFARTQSGDPVTVIAEAARRYQEGTAPRELADAEIGEAWDALATESEWSGAYWSDLSDDALWMHRAFARRCIALSRGAASAGVAAPTAEPLAGGTGAQCSTPTVSELEAIRKHAQATSVPRILYLVEAHTVKERVLSLYSTPEAAAKCRQRHTDLQEPARLIPLELDPPIL